MSSLWHFEWGAWEKWLLFFNMGTLRFIVSWLSQFALVFIKLWVHVNCFVMFTEKPVIVFLVSLEQCFVLLISFHFLYSASFFALGRFGLSHRICFVVFHFHVCWLVTLYYSVTFLSTCFFFEYIIVLRNMLISLYYFMVASSFFLLDQQIQYKLFNRHTQVLGCHNLRESLIVLPLSSGISGHRSLLRTLRLRRCVDPITLWFYDCLVIFAHRLGQGWQMRWPPWFYDCQDCRVEICIVKWISHVDSLDNLIAMKCLVAKCLYHWAYL